MPIALSNDHMKAWTKRKTLVAGAVLILVVGLTTVIVRRSNHSREEPQRTPTAKEVFEAETAKRINMAKISAVACVHFADDHQNQWPTNFAQLGAWDPDVRLSDSSWEFVSGGNRSNFGNLGQTILFRERELRQSPDGKLVKVYAFADFSIQVLSAPDDDFTALEKQRGYTIQPAKN